MPARGRIMREWHSYAREVLPRDVQQNQLSEMRRAFFAGAAAMFAAMMDSGDEDFEADGVGVIRELSDEMEEFVRGTRCGEF